MSKSYKDLIIWQKAHEVFNMVCSDVGKWPNNQISNSIRYQLLNSSGSISANIAEGYGRGGPGEFEQFLRYSRGSLAESDNWLYKSLDQKLISNDRYKLYEQIFEELQKMMAKFISELRKQKRA